VMERLLTTRELADLLGFRPATVQDWFERGELPGFRVAGRLRFQASEVDAWLEERRQPARREPHKVLHSGPRD
jgi:excisionase family DNA binding protein